MIHSKYNTILRIHVDDNMYPDACDDLTAARTWDELRALALEVHELTSVKHPDRQTCDPFDFGRLRASDAAGGAQAGAATGALAAVLARPLPVELAAAAAGGSH